MKPVAELWPTTELIDIGRTWLVSRKIATVFALQGVLQMVWLWPLLAQAVPGYPEPRSSQSLVVTLQSLSAGDLPDHLGPYLRQRFETKDRGVESSFGEFSRQWRYRLDSVQVTVAVDFPFRGWHELTQCYQGLGWTLKDRVVRDGNGSEPERTGTSVEALFERPPGRHAVLIFGIDDKGGNDLEPPPTRTMLEIGGRLDMLRFARTRLSGLADLGDQSMTEGYQVQVLVVTDEPLTPTQWALARTVFAQVRQEVRSQVASRNGAVAKRGRHDQ